MLPRNDIPWSEHAFEVHLQELNEWGAHLEDIYVAGAAGHRVDEAWEVVEQEVGPRFRLIIRSKARAGLDPEDLWSDTRTKLAEDHPQKPGCARIVVYRGFVSLLDYTVTIAVRRAVSHHRRSVARPMVVGDAASREGGGSRHAVDQIASDRGLPGINAEQREMLGQLDALLADAMALLTDEQRFLLLMIYGQDLSQRDAGALLGWHESTASRHLARARQVLQQSLGGLQDVAWTPELLAAWEACLKRLWADGPNGPEDVQGRRSGASVRQGTARETST